MDMPVPGVNSAKAIHPLLQGSVQYDSAITNKFLADGPLLNG